MSEVNHGLPMYGPWMMGNRPKPMRASRLGGGNKGVSSTSNPPNRRTWYDIMYRTKEMEKEMTDKQGEVETGQDGDPMEEEEFEGVYETPNINNAQENQKETNTEPPNTQIHKSHQSSQPTKTTNPPYTDLKNPPTETSIIPFTTKLIHDTTTQLPNTVPPITILHDEHENEWRNHNIPRWSVEGRIPIHLYTNSLETYTTISYPI